MNKLCMIAGMLLWGATASAFCLPIESFRQGGGSTLGTEGSSNKKVTWSMPAAGNSMIWAPMYFPAGATGTSCTATINFNTAETVAGKNHCFRAGFNALADVSEWAGNPGTINSLSQYSTAAQFGAQPIGAVVSQTVTATLSSFTAYRDDTGSVAACTSAAACANRLGALFIRHSSTDTGCTTNPSSFPALVEGVCVSCP